MDYFTDILSICNTFFQSNTSVSNLFEVFFFFLLLDAFPMIITKQMSFNLLLTGRNVRNNQTDQKRQHGAGFKKQRKHKQITNK